MRVEDHARASRRGDWGAAVLTLFDGTCRGNSAGKIFDLLKMYGKVLSIHDISIGTRLSTRYIHSLVDECDRLRVRWTDELVRNWVIERVGGRHV